MESLISFVFGVLIGALIVSRAHSKGYSSDIDKTFQAGREYERQ